VVCDAVKGMILCFPDKRYPRPSTITHKGITSTNGCRVLFPGSTKSYRRMYFVLLLPGEVVIFFKVILDIT